MGRGRAVLAGTERGIVKAARYGHETRRHKWTRRLRLPSQDLHSLIDSARENASGMESASLEGRQQRERSNHLKEQAGDLLALLFAGVAHAHHAARPARETSYEQRFSA